MCGRAYKTYTEEELWERYQTEKLKRNPLGELQPSFNFAPTQTMPIVLVREGFRTLETMRWGLVPSWAKDVQSADKYSLINAKCEEITEKRSYSAAFKKRRCIVPVSGFFEWKKFETGPKQPYAISLKDQKIISLAGVYEDWKSKSDGTEVKSFSVITTAPNAFMSKIHNRMPVILEREDEEKWLDPENQDPKTLLPLLRPYADEKMQAHKISVMVNSPKNNRPEILDPVH